jgi:hypothetical protein
MLPQSQDLPAASPQLAKIAQVAFSISPNLSSPERLELFFPLWQAIPVPEITVDENCNFVTSQN